MAATSNNGRAIGMWVMGILITACFGFNTYIVTRLDAHTNMPHASAQKVEDLRIDMGVTTAQYMHIVEKLAALEEEVRDLRLAVRDLEAAQGGRGGMEEGQIP